MNESVIVRHIPNCDFCGEEAKVDGKTVKGPWANMCGSCFAAYGIGLGAGKGQVLVLKEGN